MPQPSAVGVQVGGAGMVQHPPPQPQELHRPCHSSVHGCPPQQRPPGPQRTHAPPHIVRTWDRNGNTTHTTPHTAPVRGCPHAAPPHAPQMPASASGKKRSRLCLEISRRGVLCVAALLVVNVVCSTVLSHVVFFVDMEDAISKVREVAHLPGGPRFHAASMWLNVVQSFGLQILIGSLVPLCGYVAVREKKVWLLRCFSLCNTLACIVGLVTVLGLSGLLIGLPRVERSVEHFLKECDPVQCAPNGLNTTDQAPIIDCLAQGMRSDYVSAFGGPKYPRDCPHVFLKCDKAVYRGSPWNPTKDCSVSELSERFHIAREVLPELVPNFTVYLLVKVVLAIPTIALSFMGCVWALTLQAEFRKRDRDQARRRRGLARGVNGPGCPRRCRLDTEVQEGEMQEPLIQEQEIQMQPLLVGTPIRSLPPVDLRPCPQGTVMPPHPLFGFRAPQCMSYQPMVPHRDAMLSMMPGVGVPPPPHGPFAAMPHSVEVPMESLNQSSNPMAVTPHSVVEVPVESLNPSSHPIAATPHTVEVPVEWLNQSSKPAPPGQPLGCPGTAVQEAVQGTPDSELGIQPTAPPSA